MDGPDALSGASVAEPMLISKAGSASAGRAPAQAARHGALPFPGPLPFGAPFAMPMPGLPLPGMNGAPPRHAATLQEVLAGSRANGGTAAAGSGFGARPPQLPFAPFPAALSMPSATSMLKDINGHLSLQPPRPFPGLPSFSPLAALASAAQNQKQKQSPSDSKSPVSAGPQLPANGLLPGFPFKSVLPGQLPAYGAFSHLGPNPYLNHTSIPSLSAFTAMQNMAARPNTSKGPAQYGPVYPPGKPPLKRAPSASTIASSPGENGSSHTSPTASPIRAGPVVPSRAKEAKKRPAEEDLGDDDASIDSSEQSSVYGSKKSKRRSKSGMPSRKKRRPEETVAAPAATYAASNAVRVAEYQRQVAIARQQRRRRPRWEDFVHVQEEIIPCVCDGRYDGMEEIVSWIACDACEAWFHGECVQMPPSLAEIVEKWFCPACRVFEGRTHIWKDPCRNDECARRWHADTESGSKYCSRECGIQVAKRRLEASNEKRKKAWRDSIIEREAKEREVVFRERVAGLVGVPPSEWAEEAEPKDVWISPLDEDDLARLREIRHEKSLARNEMKAWLSRKSMFDKFSAKLKKLNDARKHTREPFICGFHGTVMRLFDVGPDKLSPEERALLLEENSSWVEGACQALPRTCPRHSEWVALYKDEILAELDNGAATLRRLKREETDIVETLETRMEIADAFGTQGDVNVASLVDKLIKLGPPTFLDPEVIDVAMRSVY